MTDEDLKCKSELDPVLFHVARLEETSAQCLSCVAAPCFIFYQLTILPRTSYQAELLSSRYTAITSDTLQADSRSLVNGGNSIRLCTRNMFKVLVTQLSLLLMLPANKGPWSYDKMVCLRFTICTILNLLTNQPVTQITQYNNMPTCFKLINLTKKKTTHFVPCRPYRNFSLHFPICAL